MNHRELTKQVHDNSVTKGFWQSPNYDRSLMLIVSEIGEAIEADRKGRKAKVEYYKDQIKFHFDQNEEAFIERRKELFIDLIKDSVADEIADSIIRIFDFAGGYNYVICEDPYFYTETKDWMKSLKIATGNITSMVEQGEHDNNEDYLNTAFNNLIYAAKLKGIDIELHITEKMWFNSTREKLHGKRY